MHHDGFLVGLGGPVILDNVPEVVLAKVEQQPDLAVGVGEEDALEVYHVGMLQFSVEIVQQMRISRDCAKYT